MNLLVCVATAEEIAPLNRFLRTTGEALSDDLFRYGTHSVEVLITGVGGVATAYSLGKVLQQRSFDLAIQAGIAGAFSHEVEKGSVWQVSEEYFADLGAEAGPVFMDLFEMQLLDENAPPYTQKKLLAPVLPPSVLSLLPALPAISVNMVSGNTETIKRWMKKYRPGLESMEGAAFFYVCKQEEIPFIQVRSVSNYVEVRDTARWSIGPAIQNLNDTLIRFFKKDMR